MKLIKPGDFNALFALFLDNVVNLVMLSGILINVFDFPSAIIFQKMIPGTALGVLVGNFIYTYLGIQLSKKSGKNTITAMPLGLDTPSTIGITVVILGPAFLYYKNYYDPNTAALYTWYIGMSTMLWMGIIKLISSFFGPYIQKAIPSSSLLGSLAGIGVVWLAANQFVKVMELPLVGLVSLGLILFTLIAGYNLPLKIPGAAAAVILSAAIYYIMVYFGFTKSTFSGFQSFQFLPPTFRLESFHFLFSDSLRFLPIALPFGLLTIIGGINVNEGARLAGDHYDTRKILLTEAFATIIAGLFGGVSQSTPYIGHSAYKKMGAGVGYTLMNGILIGVGSVFGLMGLIVNIIPEQAVAPLLIFVGFEIASLAYHMSPKRHDMAVTFAMVPSIINYGYIKLNSIYEPVKHSVNNLIQSQASSGVKLNISLDQFIPFIVAHEYVYLQALSQGFIVSAIIWGATVAYLIDQKSFHAMITLIVGGIFSFFGVIHSATATGEVYLPWNIKSEIPYKFSFAYIVVGIFLYFLSLISNHKSKEK